MNVCLLIGSPADINFEESLTTLKYADRAKKIKNRVPISFRLSSLLLLLLETHLHEL